MIYDIGRGEGSGYKDRSRRLLLIFFHHQIKSEPDQLAVPYFVSPG